MFFDKKKKQEQLLWNPNSKIKVYSKDEEVNEILETTHDFSPKLEIWAQVVPQTGKLQNQRSDTILANVSHKVIVRYTAGKNITRDMYIISGDDRLNIKYILNPYNRNEFLEIFCEQVIE